MRRTALAPVLLLIGAFAVGGCGEDRDAEEYAKKLGAVLKAYHDEVNQKIKAERKAYVRLAALYGRAQDEDVHESLWLQRTELSEQIADKLIGRRTAPSLSEVKTLLKRYADTDFQLTRKLLEREAAESVAFLATLESLTVETKKIEALTQVLDDLARPKSRAQRLKDLAAYAQQVDTEFRKLVCADLSHQLKDVQDQLKGATGDAKKALEDRSADLNKRIKANTCS